MRKLKVEFWTETCSLFQPLKSIAGFSGTFWLSPASRASGEKTKCNHHSEMPEAMQVLQGETGSEQMTINQPSALSSERSTCSSSQPFVLLGNKSQT